MSTVELFLLGFLMERDINGYEFFKFVEEYSLKQLLKISVSAIYKKLVLLEKNGYVKVNAVKEGSAIEKKNYAITEKGKERINILLEKVSLEPINIYYPFNTLIINIGKVDKETGEKLLNNIQKQLIKKKKYCENSLNKYSDIPVYGLEVVRQHLLIIDQMILWFNDFIKKFKE